MAEQNPTPTQDPTPTGAVNYDEVFAKLDSILDKRADGLTKSALKDNGIDEAEVADIVKAYREHKQAKANEQSTALNDAQSEITQLKQQIADRDLSDAFTAAATELGIDPANIPYVTKLADRSTAMGADGKIDAEKVKEAVNKVLTDVPAFKASASANKGFVPVGAKAGEGANSADDAEKKLRSYFGLK